MDGAERRHTGPASARRLALAYVDAADPAAVSSRRHFGKPLARRARTNVRPPSVAISWTRPPSVPRPTRAASRFGCGRARGGHGRALRPATRATASVRVVRFASSRATGGGEGGAALPQFPFSKLLPLYWPARVSREPRPPGVHVGRESSERSVGECWWS